ncbi:MAG: pimeloyl-ACP methyl ester esterase BioH [Gammaproteobacteria bacterium]|jgi:pimeloyl-[acyl-carrier protein] methyl ester esterase
MLYHKTHGQGQPIALLHGWALNSRVWDSVLPSLLSYGKVTTADLPGHGKSPLPANGRYDLDALTQEISHVIDDMESPATILGWSLGGLVALNLALRNPQQVKNIILVTASPQFVRSDDWPCAVDKQVIDGFAADLIKDYRATILRFLTLQAMGSQQAKQAIRELKEKVFINGEPQLTALQKGLAILTQTNIRPQLSDIQCPVQIIVGNKDTLIPAASGPATGELLKNSRVNVIEGAAHTPFITHRETFLDIVTDFLHDR